MVQLKISTLDLNSKMKDHDKKISDSLILSRYRR
jgi:hypothetical protein